MFLFGWEDQTKQSAAVFKKKLFQWNGEKKDIISTTFILELVYTASQMTWFHTLPSQCMKSKQHKYIQREIHCLPPAAECKSTCWHTRKNHDVRNKTSLQTHEGSSYTSFKFTLRSWIVNIHAIRLAIINSSGDKQPCWRQLTAESEASEEHLLKLYINYNKDSALFPSLLNY